MSRASNWLVQSIPAPGTGMLATQSIPFPAGATGMFAPQTLPVRTSGGPFSSNSDVKTGQPIRVDVMLSEDSSDCVGQYTLATTMDSSCRSIAEATVLSIDDVNRRLLEGRKGKYDSIDKVRNSFRKYGVFDSRSERNKSIGREYGSVSASMAVGGPDVTVRNDPWANPYETPGVTRRYILFKRYPNPFNTRIASHQEFYGVATTAGLTDARLREIALRVQAAGGPPATDRADGLQVHGALGMLQRALMAEDVFPVGLALAHHLKAGVDEPFWYWQAVPYSCNRPGLSHPVDARVINQAHEDYFRVGRLSSYCSMQNSLFAKNSMTDFVEKNKDQMYRAMERYYYFDLDNGTSRALVSRSESSRAVSIMDLS